MMTLDREAYEFYSTPSQGVVLKQFLCPSDLDWMSRVLKRPLKASEVALFVGFETAGGETKPMMHKCFFCEGTFPSVWWKCPSKEFMRDLKRTGDIAKSAEIFPLIELGCHYILNPQEPIKTQVSFCGAPFPGRDRVLNGFEHSCLRFHITKDEQIKGADQMHWGKRFNHILGEQKEALDNLAAMKAFEEERARLAAEKNARREERLKKEHLEKLQKQEAARLRKEAEAEVLRKAAQASADERKRLLLEKSRKLEEMALQPA